MPHTTAAAEYDAIAEVYDDLYRTPGDLGENELVRLTVEHMSRDVRQVIDLGAGTGLLLDLVPRLTSVTVNVDPSIGMLRRLSEKHPGALTLVGDHSTVLPPADLLTSLFGSPSYVPPDELALAVQGGVRPLGDALLMFGGPSHPGARFLQGKTDPGFTRWSINNAIQMFNGMFAEVYACQVGNFTFTVLRGKL